MATVGDNSAYLFPELEDQGFEERLQQIMQKRLSVGIKPLGSLRSPRKPITEESKS